MIEYHQVGAVHPNRPAIEVNRPYQLQKVIPLSLGDRPLESLQNL